MKKTTMMAAVLAAVLAMGLSTTAWAAIGAEDGHTGETWLIDGGPGVTNWSANVFIGNTGADNELIITNAGSLHLGASNASLYIGDKEGGDSNRVVVTGNGSRLTVTTGRDIYLGRGSADDVGGAYNSLVVENDAYLATRRLIIGFYGSHNELHIRSGAEVDLTGGWLRLGHFQGAEENEVHISGNGTTVTTPHIEIGESAFDSFSGSLLDISDKAVVNAATHVRIVSGTDSEIRISGGAQVTSASASIAGRANANDNSIVITGQGTTWTNTGGFVVNRHGSASGSRLEIRDEAVLDAASLSDAVEVWSGGTLSLDNGTLVTPDLRVAAGGVLEGRGLVQGNAAITGAVQRGATAGTLTFVGQVAMQQAAGFYLDDHTVAVTGAGSSLRVTTNAYLGDANSGAGLILNAGAVAGSESVYIGWGSASADNTVTLAGAGTSWTNASVFHVGYGGAENNRLLVQDSAHLRTADLIVGTNGTLNLDGGSIVYDGTFAVQQDGALTGSGVIDWGDTGDGAVIAGTLAPGNSAGTITFEGDLTLTSTSKVNIELGGVNDSDKLVVGGTLAVQGGALYFSLLDGFTPTEEIDIYIVEWGTVAGTEFALIDDSAVQAAAPGWSVNDDNLYSGGYVTLIPEPSTVSLLLLAAGAWFLRRRLRVA